MKEHPILFSSPMVLAIMGGKKTQTRRVMKPQPQDMDEWSGLNEYTDGRYGFQTATGIDYFCTYGRPGDRLWVRETYNGNKEVGLAYRATNPELNGCPWRPSIFMPRWASRITLEIVSVRVERLNDISEEDAMAEGVTRPPYYSAAPHYQIWFRNLWDSINAKRGYSWDSNPWVWVIEFKRVKP